MRFKIGRGDSNVGSLLSAMDEAGDDRELDRAEAEGSAMRAKRESDRTKESQLGPIADALDDAALDALWPHL